MTREVDSYRFLDFFTRKLVRAWIDAEAGAFWGVTAAHRAGTSIRFWLDGDGRHPDARIEVPRTLSPGATFRPETPLYVVGVAGRGDPRVRQQQ